MVSLDGSTLEVADEAANRERFGAPGTHQGAPGTRRFASWACWRTAPIALFGVALGGYRDPEATLAHRAIERLEPGMLCLADRGFAGYPLWAAAVRTGAQLLWRVPKNRLLPVRERLPDGSYLSAVEPAPLTRKTMADPHPAPLTVRSSTTGCPAYPTPSRSTG